MSQQALLQALSVRLDHSRECHFDAASKVGLVLSLLQVSISVQHGLLQYSDISLGCRASCQKQFSHANTDAAIRMYVQERF